MEKVRAAATVRWQDAVDFAAEAFAATGVPPADARKAAEGLVDADLHGTVTHGLKNLRNYVSQLLNGQINPKPNMRDAGGAAAARVITADNGLGHVAGHVGMERAIAVSRDTVRSQGLYTAVVTTPPSGSTRLHHHGDCETSIYVVSGVARFTWGPTGVEHEPVVLGHAQGGDGEEIGDAEGQCAEHEGAEADALGRGRQRRQRTRALEGGGVDGTGRVAHEVVHHVHAVPAGGLSMAANGRSQLEGVVARNGGRAKAILAVMRQQIAAAP